MLTSKTIVSPCSWVRKMNLKQHRFNISQNKTVERDTEGRFYLHDGTGTRKQLDRDEARKLLNLHRLNDQKNEFQFIQGTIGEQWFGHKEFFEHGKKFVRIGRNEMSRNWNEAFGRSLPKTHRSTAYNFLHGIELGLKAYMLFKDERLLPIDLKWNHDQNIVNYGHDLRKLLIDAKSKGLEIERCIVIPHEDRSEDENDGLGLTLENNWLEEIFGKASNKDERRFDMVVGLNVDRYVMKGTEYPISIYEGQEYCYLASIAGFAYTLFGQIRNTDGFFDHKRRNRHGKFDTWLQELHAQRKNHILSEAEAVEQLAELDKFFDRCDDLPSPDVEPNWEEHLEVIEQSKVRGTTNT